MCSPKLLCLPPITNTLRDLDMRFTWVLVYDVEAGSSLLVYTKFEGVSQNDRLTGGRMDEKTERQIDRQTDRCIAGIWASLDIP